MTELDPAVLRDLIDRLLVERQRLTDQLAECDRNLSEALWEFHKRLHGEDETRKEQ